MAYLVILHSRLSFLDYLGAAKELGLKTCFITQDCAFPESLRNKFDLVLENVKISEKGVEEALTKASILSEVKMYWTLNVVHVALCHKLNSEKLGLLGFSSEIANKTQNKERLRSALSKTSYNPRYFVKPVKESHENPFGDEPCVIKPFLGYSSIGVELVREPKKFKIAFEKSASVLDKIAQSISYFAPAEVCPRTHLLVEEFVEGTEYSLEMFAHNGAIRCLAICAKSPMQEPHFEEISYQMPASLPPGKQELLEQAGCDIMKTLGLVSGVAHLEVMDSPRGIIALDVGLRIGGSGLTHQLMQCSLGIGLVGACISEGLGFDPRAALEPKKSHTALLYLYQVGLGGVIAKIPEAQDLDLNDEIKLIDSAIFVRPGDILVGYPNYSGLPGYALFEIQSDLDESNKRAIDLVGLCRQQLAIRCQDVKA